MYLTRFRGTPESIGKRTGAMLAKSGSDFFTLTELDDFQKKFGRRSQQILFSLFPDLCTETEHAAEAINMPRERLASWLMTMGCCYEPMGCTAFAFRFCGKTYYGRNNDLPPALRKVCQSALYLPERHNRFLMNTSSFINGEEGLNEHGLAAAMTFVPPFPHEIKAGINSVFLVRILLEYCTCTQDALLLLKDLPIASACNILLADKSGFLAVAECSPQEVQIRKSDAYVFAANHFYSEKMQPHSPLADGPYRSAERVKTCRTALANISGDPTEFAQQLLAGRFGFMCTYRRAENFDTVWASVFCLNDLLVRRADGNPARAKFKTDARADLL